MSLRRMADKQHRWLSLVEISGVVLSEPVLADAAPTGFRMLEKQELAEFYKQRDAWRLQTGSARAEENWCEYTLDRVLGLKAQYWRTGAALPGSLIVELSDHRETLRPTRALFDGDTPVMLYMHVPGGQRLDSTWMTGGSWKASPTTKLERLLRHTGVELGLLTNGEEWRLIVASPSETLSYLTWTAQTWADAPITLAAFADLLSATRFFAGRRSDVLLELIRRSRQRQLDVADKLGAQVREALELFIHELDRIDLGTGGELLRGYTDEELYEAAVVLVMRLLFLLYAEENELLPHGNVAYDQAYGIIHLLADLENANRIDARSLEASSEAFARLLSLFRLVCHGSPDHDIQVPAHGGRLFDPDRFPLLEGRTRDGQWPVGSDGPLPVRDTVVREMLRSLKYAKGDQGEKQWVSYRMLAVEQIGYMYEGLLDRKLARTPTDQPLFLFASAAEGPAVGITLSELRDIPAQQLATALAARTGRSEATIAKLLAPPDEHRRVPEPGTEDPGLLGAARPVQFLLRPRGIIRPGGIFITEGTDRRSSGTHYTPPQLTEPVVRETLAPLVYVGVSGTMKEPRQIKTARELLDLKVCDMAMGSGAFLVQAIRYLSSRLLDAWDIAIAANPGVTLALPYADAYEEKSGAHPMPGSGPKQQPDARRELEVWAKRFVAEQCIYGVDKNPLAVEMAKLSLWLETLSRGRPFTFLDHALKCGDALLGVEQNQVQHWSLAPASGQVQQSFTTVQAQRTVQDAAALRAEIRFTPAVTTADLRAKAQKLKEADEALELLKLGGDLLLAAYLAGGTPKERKALQDRLEMPFVELMRLWTERGREPSSFSACFSKVQATADALRRGLPTFHWAFEFPEVFDRPQEGFDVIVGNPPFMGGQKITGTLGSVYRDYLVEHVAASKRGSADLVAYFFLRAFALLRQGGNLGLLGIKTITEGDTLQVGLQQVVQSGGHIYSAHPSEPWPGSASVVTHRVHIHKGKWTGDHTLRGDWVSTISLKLSPEQDWTPVPLHANFNKSFQGSVLLGLGFTLEEQEAIAIIKRDPRYADVLFPYLTGEDLNSDPSQRPSRWAINFWDWPEDRAKTYSEPYTIVLARVKPERQRRTSDGAFKLRKARAERWWQYGEKSTGLYHAIGHGRSFERHPKGWNPAAPSPSRVIVYSYVSKYWCPVFLPTNIVFSHRLGVNVMSSATDFGVLQSSIHTEWAWKFGGRHNERLNYTPTDAFETFPFPDLSRHAAELSELGEAFHELRSSLTRKFGIGLTDLYNRLHNPTEQDPSIEQLRTLQRHIDRAVAAAYGWAGLELEHGFHVVDYLPKNDAVRFTISPTARTAVLRLLLELNRAMANQQQRPE